MKKYLCIILIVFMVITGCSANEITYGTQININSSMPALMNKNKLYYSQQTEMGNDIIETDVNLEASSILVKNASCKSIFAKDNFLYYASEYEGITKIVEYNLNKKDSTVIFEVETNYNNFIQTEFLVIVKNNLVYFDGNNLWLHDGHNLEKKLENLTGVCIDDDFIYYAKQTGDVYKSNIDFTNEQLLLGINDIYNSNQNRQYLQKLGGIGTIRNIECLNDRIYFIFSDMKRDGMIFSCNENGKDIMSHWENIFVDSFQVVNDTFYIGGFTIESDTKKRGYYKSIENNEVQLIDTEGKYAKDFLIGNDTLYFIYESSIKKRDASGNLLINSLERNLLKYNLELLK